MGAYFSPDRPPGRAIADATAFTARRSGLICKKLPSVQGVEAFERVICLAQNGDQMGVAAAGGLEDNEMIP